MAAELDTLLADFARRRNLVLSDNDESGRVDLLFDGDLEIALFQAGDKVYLQGRIVELPSSAVEREDVMDNCLRKHLGQQGTRQEVLCLEPDGAALMMYRMLPARSLDAVGFERALGEFANALDHWMAETGAENRVAYSPSTMRMLFP
ncbi:MAG: type III secretion system chaperone [Chromatiaceae bacterium]|nr:type III secretion system chaperone [Chromatiaceae bacterium]MCP5315856.1 type III secretion system chaperone [Chromatiaceae bacterium]